MKQEPAILADMSPIASPDTRVSVVIPLYNHGKYIAEAVRSALDQTAKPAEIIVVDDGSTDDSADRMRELCVEHPQIIFWSQPNQGAHNAINAGIHRATGDYVSILNSDDMYCPTRFEECLAKLERDPDASAVATGLAFIDDAGAPTASEWYDRARSYYDASGDLSLALIRDNFFVTTSNLFVRRSVFEEIGYFSPLRYTHDLDFSLRLIAFGKRVHFLDRPLLKYRVHAGNTIREDGTGTNIERAAVVAFYLYTAWLQRAREDKDWPAYLGRIARIADERALGVLLADFLGRLGQFPGAGQEFGPAPRDIAFRRFARETFGGAAESTGPAVREGNLLRQTQRLADALRSLQDESAQRDATLAQQNAAIDVLEQAKRWLSGQNEQLARTLAKRNDEIESLRGWIGTLEQAKRWLAGQTENLQKELAQRETILEEQRNGIGVRDQSNKQLIAQQRQLQDEFAQLHDELSRIRRSIPWRALSAIGLGGGRRR